MIEGLKQRLIGLVVLLALLVVLAPALFRGGDTHPLVMDQPLIDTPRWEAPPVPAFVNQIDSVVGVDVDEVKSSSEVILTPEMKASEKVTGVDDKGHLKAWSLRLATFSDRNNALNLEKKLKKKGYSAFQKKVLSTSGKAFYRVYIGPEVRPDELEQARDVIKKEMSLEGIIVRFTP